MTVGDRFRMVYAPRRRSFLPQKALEDCSKQVKARYRERWEVCRYIPWSFSRASSTASRVGELCRNRRCPGRSFSFRPTQCRPSLQFGTWLRFFENRGFCLIAIEHGVHTQQVRPPQPPTTTEWGCGQRCWCCCGMGLVRIKSRSPNYKNKLSPATVGEMKVLEGWVPFLQAR